MERSVFLISLNREEENNHSFLGALREYTLITIFTFIIAIGVHVFKFPNHFSFGGASGIAVILAPVLHISNNQLLIALDLILVILGFIILGKNFGIKTAYVSLLFTAIIAMMQKFWPINEPLTDSKMLELMFATILPGIGSALLFNLGASSGGTDIVAMILKKYTNLDIGRALFICDAVVVVMSYFVFGVEIFLFSLLGLCAKSLVVDNIIESVNMSKVFNVICSDPDPICNYIVHNLKRSATIVNAEGAYTGNKKYIIFTAMKSYQALLLRQFIYKNQPSAFILISNTSEIIGRGFGNFF